MNHGALGGFSYVILFTLPELNLTLLFLLTVVILVQWSSKWEQLGL